MVNQLNLYQGGNYGLDPYYGGDFLGTTYRTPSAQIGTAIDPRTANQLKKVSDALSTGVQSVEVQFTTADVSESIPNQHLDEINRLRKLVGNELTLHGVLVEPTGITRNGWDEKQRQQAEEQIRAQTP